MPAYECCAYFSPSLPFIEDGYRYTDELRRDVQAADLIYPATLDQHRTFCTARHGATPSRTALDDWTHTESPDVNQAGAEPVVGNDLLYLFRRVPARRGLDHHRGQAVVSRHRVRCVDESTVP